LQYVRIVMLESVGAENANRFVFIIYIN